MSAETPAESLIPLVVIAGPTATGKTALAIALADRLRPAWEAEVVSADARQIYHLMDIATAKPTAAERARLPHHLLDIVWPDETLTLAEYQRLANTAIAKVWARGRLPLLVGGGGLYIRAVVDGLAIPEVAPQPELRAELEALLAAEGVAALYARLASLDPVAAARIDARNPRRLIRALEVCLVTGRPFSEQQGARPTPYHPLFFGLNMERDALYARADARIDAMLAAGLVAETEALLARGYGWMLPSMSSLGYREIGAYLRGEATLDEAISRFKQATHGYIRRQLTWFRRDERISWLDAALPSDALAEQVAERLLPWLDV
ncbi:MAG TPA: tRNA (adenosine(37)-N6)-dimethylallyltransferase MiaA [Ktedonobacterales bacterium]|jgi:tRNA dimethylallyltransferase|nr:tRNA (adenosine(37)-N6)-dimethylallyltransferase MiaA [Ktedonobacterales bacterium]